MPFPLTQRLGLILNQGRGDGGASMLVCLQDNVVVKLPYHGTWKMLGQEWCPKAFRHILQLPRGK